MNGSNFALGIVGALAAVGLANRAGLYGSRSVAVEVPANAVFYATSRGGKYQYVVTPTGATYRGEPTYEMRDYTRGQNVGFGTNTLEGLRKRIPDLLKYGADLDGIHYDVKIDTLGLAKG